MSQPNIAPQIPGAPLIPSDMTPELPLELRMEAERVEWEKQQLNNTEPGE